jgi:hypothetical protein
MYHCSNFQREPKNHQTLRRRESFPGETGNSQVWWRRSHMQMAVLFLAVHMLAGCKQPGEKRNERTAFSRNGVNSFAEGQSQFN